MKTRWLGERCPYCHFESFLPALRQSEAWPHNYTIFSVDSNGQKSTSCPERIGISPELNSNSIFAEIQTTCFHSESIEQQRKPKAQIAWFFLKVNVFPCWRIRLGEKHIVPSSLSNSNLTLSRRTPQPQRLRESSARPILSLN